LTLGQTVKLLRKKNSWKQRFLAERLGISFETVSAIERDKRLPGGQLLGRLSRELGTTVEFLTREDPRFTKPTKTKLKLAPVEDTDAILKSLHIHVIQGKLTLEQIVRATLGLDE
jgi:transcriptional regulator with XRE-family HTH domain